MGLLNQLLGNASEIDPVELDEDFESILVPGEVPKQAYRARRDLIVFTNKRLVLVDRQGMTGKKVSYDSIPYSRITRFAKEGQGNFDLDAELKVWVSGASEPVSLSFQNDTSIHKIYLLLSIYVLG
jgi:hypothetical protein